MIYDILLCNFSYILQQCVVVYINELWKNKIQNYISAIKFLSVLVGNKCKAKKKN